MAEEHKIIVEFQGNGNALPGPTEVNTQGSGSTQIPKSQSQMKQTAMTSVIQKSAKTVYNSSIARVGDFTGDYLMQNRINNTMKIAGYATLIALNPVVGIPATALAVGFQVFDYNLRVDRSNREAARVRELNGGLTSDFSIKRGRYS